MLVGSGGGAVIAIAVFLFAPYTRFVTLFPGPFVAGPIYSIAVALCALVACRRRSEAALAALGACAGIAVTYPGVVPTVAFFVAWAIWRLRRSLRALWVGLAVGCASFAAAVIPASTHVLRPAEMTSHFRWDGPIARVDATLLGQIPLQYYVPGLGAPPPASDIVVAAVLAPFAHPRIAIRLWGDALFDPLGGALIAIGLATCIATARRSSAARVLLAFSGAALCPAFVSPVDVVDIVHAVAIPVPAALLAACGFAAVRQRIRWRRSRGRIAAAMAAVAIGVGGTVLFDVVNPRILSGSSHGIMFRALATEDADRVVVLDYAKKLGPDVRWLMTGPVTAFAGPRPVGFLEYAGGPLPRGELAEEHKDLLFWSPGLEDDLSVARAVCAQWPDAILYEIWDEARLGRVYAAGLSARGWKPRAPRDRWRSWRCGSAP